jgi:putative tricarboxylic transport membrane protein
MKISDTVVGAGFVMAGALIFAGTLSYPPLDDGQPGPSLFPRLVAALMAGFGATLSVKGFRARDVSEALHWRGLHRSTGFVNAVFVLAGVLAYIVLVERLGFLIVGAVVIFVLMWRLEVRWPRALVIAVVFNALVHLLFAKILRVPLPLGLLWW